MTITNDDNSKKKKIKNDNKENIQTKITNQNHQNN